MEILPTSFKLAVLWSHRAHYQQHKKCQMQPTTGKEMAAIELSFKNVDCLVVFRSGLWMYPEVLAGDPEHTYCCTCAVCTPVQRMVVKMKTVYLCAPTYIDMGNQRSEWTCMSLPVLRLPSYALYDSVWEMRTWASGSSACTWKTKDATIADDDSRKSRKKKMKTNTKLNSTCSLFTVRDATR